MSHPTPQIVEELTACIACGECLAACPALAEPIPIETLNRETFHGPASVAVARFARACYQCGACVPVCPVGLHRDAMMMSLKVQLLLGPDWLSQRTAGDAAPPVASTRGPRAAFPRGRRYGN
jgi:ferredoxin